MSRKAVVVVAVLLMVMVPAALFAQKGEMAKKEKGACRMGAGAHLELEPEQRVQMEKLRLKLELANIDIKAEQMELHKKIEEELLKEEPSKKAIAAHVKALAANREKVQMNRIDHMFEVKKMLTAEQWKIFVANHRDGMGCGEGCGMGHRGCGRMKGSMGHGAMGGCRMGERMEGRGERGTCPMAEMKEQ